MKNIYLTSEQFNYLTSICNNNQYEVSGMLYSKNVNDGICIGNIIFDQDDEVEERAYDHISLDKEKMVYKIFCMLQNNRGDYIIGFHTHPKSQIKSCPSKSDKEFIKAEQLTIDLLIKKGNERKLLNRELGATYVECIIHPRSISFWHYDKETNKVKEIDFYVDGKLIDNNRENSILKAFSIGFKSGMTERKR